MSLPAPGNPARYNRNADGLRLSQRGRGPQAKATKDPAGAEGRTRGGEPETATDFTHDTDCGEGWGAKRIPDHIESLVPYHPGPGVMEIQKLYGVPQVLELASNENCLGASPLAVEAMREYLRQSHRYSNGGWDLRKALAGRFGCSVENAIVGAGSEAFLLAGNDRDAGTGTDRRSPALAEQRYNVRVDPCSSASLLRPGSNDVPADRLSLSRRFTNVQV